MIYRAATTADEPFLYRLYAATRAEEVAAWGWPADAAEAFLRLQWTAQQRHYALAYPGAERQIVCSDDGEPVGQVLCWESGDALRLVDIALLPDSRGRGIGSRIILDLQQRASAAGRSIRLQVAPANPARRLYARLGFVEVEHGDTGIELEWKAG